MRLRALQFARECGVAVEFEDLGDWGRDRLHSEYDPAGPTIRINRRVLDALPPHERDAFVALAIGHELYHHRERIGDVPREHDRVAREQAAQAFALELVAKP